MSQLSIYNKALRHCKERRIASLTENREPIRLLNDAWADGRTEGVVKRCLEMGQWSFARRMVMLDSSPSDAPDFGYAYAFTQPEDMVRPCGIFEDEYGNSPLLRYSDERRFWFADLDPIYVCYVSNGATYGADLSLWTEAFSDLVSAELAMEIVGNLTQGNLGDVAAIHKKAKMEAMSLDAMNMPTSFAPRGSWSQARMQGRSSTRDRGQRAW